MLVPPWKLPVIIVALSLLAVLLLPGAEPGVLFGGVLLAWIAAFALFIVLHLRHRQTRR
jgi:hypothetical protein